MLQVFVLRGKFGGYRKMGKEDIPFQIQQLNLINDFIGIVNGFRKIMEYLAISSGGLEIELVVGKCKTFILHQDIVIRKFPHVRASLAFRWY